MTHPVEIAIRCRDCGTTPTRITDDGRCWPCSRVAGIADLASANDIRCTIIRTGLAAPRVTATGADGRPAWLDTLSDVRYLAREIEYLRGPIPALALVPKPKPWSRAHERCVECGGTEKPHHAKGLCINCHGRLGNRRYLRSHGKIIRRLDAA
jgi:hypothetical protein